MRVPLSLVILGAAVAVSGCSNQGLRDLRAPGTGPDEFMILPAKPLTAPQDYAVLPAPTPGGSNLTDQNPTADAVAALGGNPAALNPNTGIPSSDAALVTAASRKGVSPNTRVALAEEDAKFRKRQARSTRFRLFPVDRYKQAYRKQSLDPFKQTELFRSRNAGTPTSPPEQD